MSKITPTFNSKLSQRIDNLVQCLDPMNRHSVIAREYRAILSSISDAMLSGTDADPSVRNFIQDHMTYFRNRIPEMYYVLLLVLSLRDDDISKNITEQHIQDAATEAFISISKRYSQIISSKVQYIFLQKYHVNINYLTYAILGFTIDIKNAFSITTIDRTERFTLINKAKVFTNNALKYMVDNNVPYLLNILDNIPIAWGDAPVHHSMFEQKDNGEDVSKYQKKFNYRNVCDNYSIVNPNCVEAMTHKTTSYNDMIEEINEFITKEYAAIDIHSMFMIQKHMDSSSTTKPTEAQTFSCQYHVGLSIVYYYEVMGIDVSEMLTEDYIKFIFKTNGNSNKESSHNFIIVHNCIAYLDKKFGYDKDVMRSLGNYRNYLKLTKSI